MNTRMNHDCCLKLPARPVSCSLFFSASALASALLLISSARAGEPTIRFNRDIRPILSENCLACHGPDNNARKANLRLDTKDGLFERTPKREPAVVPGNLKQSELWRRVTATDPDDVMPPPKSHKVLKPEQKELLKQWIAAGAPWEGHWAFLKPERPNVRAATSFKTSSARFPVRNPVDAFVLAKLEARGLEPAAEADRRTLIRRVTLDLTGLPPRPEDVESFVRDRSPTAYEKLVKKLLASPQWGEQRARYWLDAARYADTHGLHFDNYREMWPYRDWVIRAFNQNLPFDQFTVRQLAGDLLDNPTDDDLVATGFHRCNMTTNEGGTIEEENLANYANDRVTTTGWVWLGLTFNCCACHDHKFDPITTRDFYSLAAFFRNTKQTGFDKNWRESDLYMVVPQTDTDRARWKALPAELDQARKSVAAQQIAAEPAFTNWLVQLKPEAASRELALAGETVRVPLTEGLGTIVNGRVEGATKEFSGPGELAWRTDGPLGGAPVLTKENSFVLGEAGALDTYEPFSVSAWVWVPPEFKGSGAILARMGGEEEHFRGWDFFLRDEEFGIHLVHRWPSVSLVVRSSDKAVKRGAWQQLLATYDGSGRADGVKLFVNGVEVNGNRDQDRLEGTIRTPLPLRLGRRERNEQLDGVAVQDVRLVRRQLAGHEARALAAAPRLAEWRAAATPDNTNAAPRAALRDYFLVTQNTAWRTNAAQLAQLELEQQTIRGRSPVTLIQQEKKDSEPTAQILFRGQYDKPKDKVGAATPAVLPPMPAGAPTNRLGLAKWVVAADNPLTARVTVNRFWQELCGVGLVKSTEDFGIMGETPVNPELLDWLAVEFQSSGWDVKHLFELIVTSSAYRQSAETTPAKLERDPQNRLLSRGPRFRMDAEMVRDYALAASGLLAGSIGGPSVKPYQPGGLWEAVAMPESNTRYYTRDEGAALYRRSLYTFWKRAAPPASMDLFNAPSRETCAVRRERTNTPLQALATLNDPQFVEAARQLAVLALTRSRGRNDGALDVMAERLLARPLTAQERTIVNRTLAETQAYYEQQPEAAKEFLAVGETHAAGKLPLPQLAALTLVANQLMNLDEVLNK